MDILGYSLATILTVLGFGLIFIEALIPGGVFIILGVTVFITGVAGLLIPSLGTPIGLLVTMLIVAPSVYLAYSRLDIYGGDDTGVRGTSDSSSLEGVSGRVIETVTDESGKVKLEQGGMNPNYMARTEGEPLEEGTDVVVTDPGGGNVVTVTAVDEGSADEDAAQAE